MFEVISEILHSCCTLKKNQKDDEYIFILCPAPSDLEEEYIDSEGNIKKKRLERVRGTARSIVDDDIVREWSGREIGSCICCHLIYEDDMNVYRSSKHSKTLDTNKVESSGRKSSRQGDSKSVGSLSSYSSKKHFSDEPNISSNSAHINSDESEDEIKSKKIKGKKKLNKSNSSIGADDKSNGIEDKDQSKMAKDGDINHEKITSHCDSSSTLLKTNNRKSAQEEKGNNLMDKGDKRILIKNKCSNLSKNAKSSYASKSLSGPPVLGKRSALKSDIKNTANYNNKQSAMFSKNGERATKLILSSQNDKTIKTSMNKEKSDEVRDANQSSEHDQSDLDHQISSDSDNHSSSNSSNSSSSYISDSSSGSDEKIADSSEQIKYDEEEMKFNKDISSKIISNRELIGIQAEIILKDGSAMNCKVSFSDREDDLSFICGDKVKAVPWNNIREVFTKKSELRMVNTKVPLFKDPTLIVALHLKDTGNCIPLKFNSKESKEKFLSFAAEMIR